MSQFQVPQFIDVEDKIFGPLTLKQFVYVAGGAGLSFVLWKTLASFVALPLIGIVAGLSIALAFFKINNRPFVIILEAAFMFVTHSRLYLWQTNRKRSKKQEKAAADTAPVNVPDLSNHKLKSLAWSLDINEHLNIERDKEESSTVMPSTNNSILSSKL